MEFTFFINLTREMENLLTISIGALDSFSRVAHFFIDLAKDNERIIIPGIEARQFQMLYAPRATGKTTRTLTLCEQLVSKNYTVLLYVVLVFAAFSIFTSYRSSFDAGIDMTNRKKFWTSFSEDLAKDGQPVRFTSAREFINMFVKTKSPFRDKKIVLVIDEFDQIYHASDALQAEVLQTLRNLRQMRAAYNLWV